MAVCRVCAQSRCVGWLAPRVQFWLLGWLTFLYIITFFRLNGAAELLPFVLKKTRLIVTQLTHCIIEAQIITGKAKGTKTYIPRVVTTSSDPKWPFKIKRRQFLVRVSYAMTINRSQGQTLDIVGVYLPTPVLPTLCCILTCYITWRLTDTN